MVGLDCLKGKGLVVEGVIEGARVVDEGVMDGV